MCNSVKLAKRGFTLVELMIVVAIIGVLAALAIYGVTRYVANAKTTEARTAVARIAKDATTAYARPKTSTSALTAGGVLDPSGPGAAISNELCGSSSKVPATVPAGKKLQSATADWDNAGWKCLQFSMSDPQMYQYEYQNPSATAFHAVGVGDLDGDNTLSTFKMSGEVQTDKTLLVSPTIIEDNPLE